MSKLSIHAAVSFLFIATVGMGVFFQSQHRTQVVLIEFGEGRGPAAVNRALDLSHLDGMALSKRINERLIGDAHILNRNDSIGIELGQFVTEGRDGKKRLACSIYSKIEMIFIGEGIGEGGAQPHMVVAGPCNFSDKNISWMEPIWIPYKTILEDPPGNKEIRFYDSEPVELSFSNMTSEWPSLWVLKAIRLYSEKQPTHEIIVSHDEIRKAAPKSIVLQW